MINKCGIYIIKNSINNLVYIGQSVDISVRWNAHKRSALNKKAQDHYTKIHQAMNKLGVKNFYCELLEECKYNELSEKEIYWIEKLNSYENGYNMTRGGESNKGETNGNHKITLEQVIEIRTAYANHIPFREVCDKYLNQISKSGLRKIWQFQTWKNIMPEVYSEENRLWHKTYAKKHENRNKQLGENNQKRACSEEEIKKIRELRESGLSYNKISQLVGRSKSVVRKYCLFQECKNPTKNGWSVQVKNIETNLIFNSYTLAAKWANCDRKIISKAVNLNKTAGTVPTTGAAAHWITLQPVSTIPVVGK